MLRKDVLPSRSPPSAAGNTVTIGDLSGTGTKRVEVDESKGSVDASGQNNPNLRLDVNGRYDTILTGASDVWTSHHTPPTGASLLLALHNR
jgi:hypothetical protein